MIKHVSFDVWNTLIKPNPEFATLRTRWLALMLQVPERTVREAYTALKTEVDAAAERNGIAYATSNLYTMLFQRLGCQVPYTTQLLIRVGVEDLFCGYPPIIEDSVRQCVAELRCRGITMSLSSNSNFISGNVMLPFLQHEFEYQFNGSVFSDLFSASKPSAPFFQQVIMNAKAEHPDDEFKPWNILHVGDNEVCDREGPRKQSIHSVIIKSPDDLYEQVIDRVSVENDRGIDYSVDLLYPHSINAAEISKGL